uniref:Fluoride-specific ion channel FluC n=1 Tax=uncultured Thiotrichaceae bacterium TaxID=298394 RepID=A0A6S6SGG1_9GAMM|nr:MAG: CrcB protein [uncultured Thiotrichaceae bacterium]
MGQIAGIMLGGAVGALLRFLASNAVYQLFGRTLPYGTLAVNVIGSFLIGLLSMYFIQRAMLDTPLAKGLMVGVLGAFTTFSTFSLDTFYLLEQGAWLKGVLNILLNVFLCLGAVWLGMLAAKIL